VASTYSVRDLRERYTVSEHTILSWIRSGELRAISVARKQGGRPTWRVTQQALEEFEVLRMATPPLPKARRRKQADVIQFYT
jgi:transposase